MYGTPLHDAYDKFIEENGGADRLTYLRAQEVLQGEVAVVVMGPQGFWDMVLVLFGRFTPKAYFANQHDNEIVCEIVE